LYLLSRIDGDGLVDKWVKSILTPPPIIFLHLHKDWTNVAISILSGEKEKLGREVLYIDKKSARLD
jgi:hypothetical protein